MFRKSCSFLVVSWIPRSISHVHLGMCEPHLSLETGRDPHHVNRTQGPRLLWHDRKDSVCVLFSFSLTAAFHCSTTIISWAPMTQALGLHMDLSPHQHRPFHAPDLPSQYSTSIFYRGLLAPSLQTCFHDLKSEPLLTPATPNLLSRQ